MRLWNYFLIIMTGFYLVSCEHSSKKDTRADILFPAQSHTILQINHKNQFLNIASNNAFWNNYCNYLPNANVRNMLHSLSSNSDIWLAYTANDVFCISLQNDNDSLSIWKGASPMKIDSVLLKNKKWFYTKYKTQLIVSNTKKIPDFSSFSKDSLKDLYALHKNIDNIQSPANLFLSQTETKKFFHPIFPSRSWDYFKSWTAWDIFLEKNQIRMNGTALNQNDSLNIATLLKTKPIDNQIVELIPSEIQNLRSYSFSDSDDLQLKHEIVTELPKYISEVASFTLNSEVLVAFNSSDSEETLRQLSTSKEDLYNDYRIISIEDTSDLELFLRNFDIELQPKYTFLHNSILFFASKEETLKKIINHLQTNTTFVNNQYYNQLKEFSASKTSYFEIENLQKNATFTKKYASIANKYQLASLQITPQNEYYICSFSSIQADKKINTDGLSEKYHLTLDAPAQTSPKWIVNHRTKRKEIVVQDIDNQLYLISNDGKLLWKKKLDAPIKGMISQVDLFKNGNLQMAFNTEQSLWVIDRNGNNVTPFPISYKKELLPLEIFDYEHSMEYRFVVTTNNQIRILDKKGNLVNGFEKEKIPNGIVHTPKHFRVNGKDYIVFGENNGVLNILHRNGKTRIPITERFNFSKNPIHLQNDWFVFTTKEGKQVFIDQKGGIRVENRQLASDHHITYRHQNEAVMSNNRLIINKKEIELPYGNYTSPRIYRIGNVVYVSVTDTQNNKVYLLTSQGEMVRNFPIFGSSAIDITIDNGNSLLTFLKDNQTIFVYDF